MRASRRVNQFLCVLVVAGGLAFVPMYASAAESCGTMQDGWAKINDAIGQSYSPWYDTAQGIGFKRKIQFRALGGIVAQRCIAGKPTGEQATFFYANTYRLESCLRPTACTKSDWIGYGRHPEKPAGYRWPNQAAGLDPFYRIYKSWPI